jgi:hypothetical protein
MDRSCFARLRFLNVRIVTPSASNPTIGAATSDRIGGDPGGAQPERHGE